MLKMGVVMGYQLKKFYGVVSTTLLCLFGAPLTANAQSDPHSYTVNGTTMTYSQNDAGATMTVQDARGVLTRYLYNNLGLITEEHSAERGAIKYSYDENGNIIHQESEGGLIFKRDYDAQNRMTREVMKQNGVDRKVNRYTYDSCANGEGRLCKLVSDGHVTKYSYTEKGHIASESTRYAGEEGFETTRYSYDEKGRAIKLRYPTGLTVRYHYAGNNLVNKITGRYETGEDRESFVIAKNLTFNPDTQRLIGMTYGNGLRTTLDYGDDNILQNIKTLADGELIDRSSFARNDRGHITDIGRLNENESVHYAYDDVGRLIHEQRGVDTATQRFVSYNYDAVGNRLTYDNGAKQSAFVYGPQVNRLDEVNRKTLSYDVRGNLISDRQGKRRFEYDVTNRISAFYKEDELRATYDYNAFGQRISKTLHRPARGDDSYRSLHFAYTAKGWLLSEFGRDSDKKRNFARDYVWLGTKPIAQIERKIRPDGTTHKANVTFLHTDHLNTPRWATNNSGDTVWRWESDGFGKGKADRDVDRNGKKTVIRLRFPGQYHDKESGLYYNHHRDYDPRLGRYIQSDPIGLNGGINRYAYVGGDPVNYIDPNGLSRISPSDTSDEIIVYGSHSPSYDPAFVQSVDIYGGGGGGIVSIGGATSVPGYNDGSPTGFSTEEINCDETPEQCVETTSTIIRPASVTPGGLPVVGVTQVAGWLSGPHSYDIPPIKTPCTADQLFEAWRQPGNSAPTNEYATAGTRTVVLLGNNPITQTVDVQNRIILNRTQASHAFHSGTVLISVTSTADGGSQSIVTGRGDGAVPWFNNMVGAFLFRPAQQRASIDCAKF